jgi:hypothetical protein
LFGREIDNGKENKKMEELKEKIEELGDKVGKGLEKLS